ncbi:HrpB1 family type III secretion system apparatus protein [Ramlibacter tataouinensis]|nr:HrpB1 family type III secretion system apparatus protein [Ramlibacter tataouinensis]
MQTFDTPPLPSDAPSLPDEVFDALVGVLSVAPQDTASDDVLVSLQALQAARPHLPELSIALAQRHLLAKDLVSARDVLESADRRAPRQPLVGALLAFTLHALKDPTWRLRAFEVEGAPCDDLSELLLATLRDPASSC